MASVRQYNKKQLDQIVKLYRNHENLQGTARSVPSTTAKPVKPFERLDQNQAISKDIKKCLVLAIVFTLLIFVVYFLDNRLHFLESWGKLLLKALLD